MQSQWADSVFNSLSPKERIAQLVFASAFPYKDSMHIKSTCEIVSKYNVGGIIFFRGGPLTMVNLSNKLQKLAKTPMIMSIDGEWGLAMRTDSTLVYPKQMMLGALNDNILIYQMGADIAWQLHRMGLHTNFAPVVDINNNPKNPVINSRSFGDDKEKVLAKSLQYMQGLQDNFILATAKHFPGHGDTETDSHLSLPILNYSYYHLDSFELYPFKQLINKGVSGVMVAHLNIPSLDSTGRPGTLSPAIVTGLLKEKLSFNGLIFTDALNMKGVSTRSSQEVVALQAFMAGNDVLLMPDDIPKVLVKLKEAADSGIISYDEINRRCMKILQAKYWLGLNHYKEIDTQNLIADLHKPNFELNRRKLVESAITVVKNEKNLIPLQRLDTLKIACISVGSKDTSIFQERLNMYAQIENYSIDRDAPDSLFDETLNELKKYNLVVAGLLNTDMRYSRNFGITERCVKFINRLADSTNVVFDLFANPYSLERFIPTDKFKTIIVSYEDKEINQDLSAQLIFGGIAAKGTLPVKASAEFANGASVQWDKTTRLKYTTPEELGIDSKALQPIDSLVNDAIKKHAIPGCVVYLAKDGKVFYNKAFGHFTFDSTRVVKTSDIYDLASLTKVCATTPALMMLYDKKQISLSDKLSKYIPELNKTNKKKILVSEVLSHQARLKEWLPFYLSTIECVNSKEKLFSKTSISEKSVKLLDGSFINCDTKYKDGIYNKNYSSQFSLKVADSLYINHLWKDTILNQIYISTLLPKEGYKYSDWGFILLGKAITNVSGKPLDQLLDTSLYIQLGAKTLGFNPLHKFDRKDIAPTENDLIWRKQLIQGYVHDHTAAMLGGVCGHAGLFSNANDLGILMQLYLNGGEYGGQRYFKTSTLNLFNSRMYVKTGNRRGLGFDKPEPDLSKQSPVSRMCSDESFGHTGFTGTMTWVDPKYNLVYIFLSNRVYPDASVNKLAEINLRTNIQDIVYKAINKK